MTAQLFATTGATCLPMMSGPAIGRDFGKALFAPRAASTAHRIAWQLPPGTACILAVLAGAAFWVGLAVVLLA